MNLPKELQEVILGYIDPKDKVYVSMACTLFKRILESQFNQKYKNGNSLPTECAYDLYLYLCKFGTPDNVYFTQDSQFVSTFNIFIINNNDINIANVLAYCKIKNDQFCIDYVSILKEYCKRNYISRPKYIKYFMRKMFTQCILIERRHKMEKLLTLSLQHKSFNIINYLLAYGGKCAQAIKNIKWSL